MFDAWITSVEGLMPHLYAPSVRAERFAYSPYGVGHTNLRRPGEMRGTVFGKKSRYRNLRCERGVEL